MTETRELVGRAAAALPALPHERLSATVADAEKLAHVEPESSYSPSHIAGRLGGADHGRLVSTGRSFAPSGRTG